eukprot:10448584-Ditylum_brightwellii.AAC.1
MESWKYTRKQWLEILEGADWDAHEEADTLNAPSQIKAVLRLIRNLLALKKLSVSETPPPRLVCRVTANHDVYGFVDVSSRGFCLSFWKQGTSKCSGLLGSRSQKGRLVGAEICLFGDN